MSYQTLPDPEIVFAQVQEGTIDAAQFRSYIIGWFNNGHDRGYKDAVAKQSGVKEIPKDLL